MYHYFYKITNTINEHYYVGIHSTENLNDGYFGSGKDLKKAIRKFGKSSFKKENLKFFDSREELSEYEKNYIKEYDCLSDPICYNISPGGENRDFLNYVTLKNVKTGKNALYDKTDPEVIKLREEKILVSPCKGFKLYKNLITGKSEYLEIRNEETIRRLKIKEIIPNGKGKTTFLNLETGQKEFVSIDDPRIKQGILVGHTKGYGIYKNVHTGEAKRFNINDPELKTGNWESFNKGKAVYRNLITGKLVQYERDSEETKKLIKTGIIETARKNQFVYYNTITGKNESAFKDDPRRKTGELVNITKGKLRVVDTRDGKLKTVSKEEYESNKQFYINEKRGKQAYYDENKNIVYLSPEEAKSKGYHGLRYKMIKLIKITGERRVCKKEELDDLLKKGWSIGQKIYKVKKGNEERTILKKDIPEYYKSGWEFDIKSIRLYIKGYSKMFLLSEMELFLKDGWKLQKDY